MALDVGTTAPEIMLLPYSSDPETGSQIPSMSTGGAATNATMKTVVAVSRVGIIRTPNHPTYSLFCVEVMNDASLVQTESSEDLTHSVEVISREY